MKSWKHVFIPKLFIPGDDFPSCTALVEAVYALEAEEKARSEEQTTHTPNDQSAVTQPLSDPCENEEGTESAGQNNDRDDMACTQKMGEGTVGIVEICVR